MGRNYLKMTGKNIDIDEIDTSNNYLLSLDGSNLSFISNKNFDLILKAKDEGTVNNILSNTYNKFINEKYDGSDVDSSRITILLARTMIRLSNYTTNTEIKDKIQAARRITHDRIASSNKILNIRN